MKPTLLSTASEQARMAQLFNHVRDAVIMIDPAGTVGFSVWLEGHFQPVHDPHGKRIGCAILLHDVTKWRAAEAARKASEELLRSVTDSVPGAVFQIRIAAGGA